MMNFTKKYSFQLNRLLLIKMKADVINPDVIFNHKPVSLEPRCLSTTLAI